MQYGQDIMMIEYHQLRYGCTCVQLQGGPTDKAKANQCFYALTLCYVNKMNKSFKFFKAL